MKWYLEHAYNAAPARLGTKLHVLVADAAAEDGDDTHAVRWRSVCWACKLTVRFRLMFLWGLVKVM